GSWPKRCRAFALATAVQNERTASAAFYGVRRQNAVATALWPWSCVWVNPVRWELVKAVSRALALATAVQNERTVSAAFYGVRRQNAVTTALWPWSCVWVNPVRWELAKAVSRALALATAVQNERNSPSIALWSAPAERSGDGALAMVVRVGKSCALGVGQSGVARSRACHRTPK
ncbi:MAG: hypothetical protein AB1813_24605, partial [Verrucomicrobiota bacterium]